MGESVVSHSAVVALNVGVLSLLSGLDKVYTDAALCGPGKDYGAVLRTIIATNNQRLASSFNDSIG